MMNADIGKTKVFSNLEVLVWLKLTVPFLLFEGPSRFFNILLYLYWESRLPSPSLLIIICFIQTGGN